ncbi:MAG: DnaJ domain-containing protein [Candidatus Altiarchaeales archaeon]|nr:DnaJ domain-containing protein [Candidatus Altiarchaeales archaeon]MBD3417320.1 DnaJ domain-containing protein [Candidatus Altiarchaeales archaeon]
MNAEEIDKARRLLGLGVDARESEIKEAHRNLAKKHHPDGNGKGENFTSIQEAYDLLMEYIEEYRYSFSADEVRKQHPEEMWRERYQNDPIWGRGNKKKNSKRSSYSSY